VLSAFASGFDVIVESATQLGRVEKFEIRGVEVTHSVSDSLDLLYKIMHRWVLSAFASGFDGIGESATQLGRVEKFDIRGVGGSHLGRRVRAERRPR
jgi:hypothetical protein